MITVAINKYKESFDVDITRNSKWGNPFSVKEKSRASYQAVSREDSIEKHKFWLLGQPHLIADLGELKDKRLGCVCWPKKCHGDFLAELADRFDPNADFSDYSAFWD